MPNLTELAKGLPITPLEIRQVRKGGLEDVVITPAQWDFLYAALAAVRELDEAKQLAQDGLAILNGGPEQEKLLARMRRHKADVETVAREWLRKADNDNKERNVPRPCKCPTCKAARRLLGEE